MGNTRVLEWRPDGTFNIRLRRDDDNIDLGSDPSSLVRLVREGGSSSTVWSVGVEFFARPKDDILEYQSRVTRLHS
jgi:hypothetical protein